MQARRADLMSVKDDLATPQGAAKDAKKQLHSLQKKQDTFESRLFAGFNKDQAAWEEEREAFCKEAETA